MVCCCVDEVGESSVFERIPDEPELSQPTPSGHMAQHLKIPSRAEPTLRKLSVKPGPFTTADMQGAGFNDDNYLADTYGNEGLKDEAVGAELQIGEITITNGTKSGINLLKHEAGGDPKLIVKEVSSGPWRVWNDKNVDLALRPWDRILEVNGVRGDAKMLIAELQRKSEGDCQMSLCIRRPVLINVELENKAITQSKSLGIALTDVSGLFIVKTLETWGLIHEWNQRQAGNPDLVVRENDCLFEANGSTGRDEILNVITNASRLDLVFLRQS